MFAKDRVVGKVGHWSGGRLGAMATPAPWPIFANIITQGYIRLFTVCALNLSSVLFFVVYIPSIYRPCCRYIEVLLYITVIVPLYTDNKVGI